MSFLEKLLEGEKVIWNTLGEVADFTNGKGHEKDIVEDGKYIVVNSKFISTNGMIAKFSNKQICPLLTNDISIVMSDLPNGKALAKTFFVNEDGKYTLNQRIGGIRVKDSNILFPKFLSYILNRTPQLLKFNDGANQTNLSRGQIESVEIPIPPIATQQKIVGILDKFTELIAELTAELTCRRQQYSYYRDQLLSFEDTELEWSTVDKIFNLKNGYTPSKSNPNYWKDGTIPWFRMEDIRENGRILGNAIQYVNSSAIKGGKLFPGNSIIVSTSATIGEHALISVPFLSNQRFTCLSLKNEFSHKFQIKFLFYYGFVLAEWCKSNVTVGNFAGVDMVGFKKFKIPIPSLEHQSHIISILDKFDMLTTSKSEGLPKEIELRKQQFEYYRELLLTFPKDELSE
ncbi:restriction endonuclease subunit S [Chryseobacterium bernardetii]|uniref:restriction endonuclease subunit S n=1 Tax=Chryseobacterium bernardetii TaxID=1241978 RepID=UPI003AF46291